MDDTTFSMRTYLIVKTMILAECDWLMASEAVASTAIEHPEWDLTERKPWVDCGGR